MSICKNYIKVAYAVTGHKTAIMTRLRCKRWTCEYCCKKNARMWQYWLIKRIPEVSERWWLVTLTAASNKRTTLQSLTNLRMGIDTLIKRLKRVFGGIEYVRVFEVHPTSEAVHVHFIMSGLKNFVVWRKSNKGVRIGHGSDTRTGHRGTWSILTWFKKTAGDLKMGYQADVQEFTGDTKIASFYVTKYLTKEQGKLNIRYLRHVQVTRGIGSPKFEVSYTWQTASYITAYTFTEPNTRVTDIDTGRVIDNDYWEHTGYYPDDNLTT